MELNQLRYAAALASTMNFTRAAERCHVVQSALSHQIKRLESELGVRLFERTNRRVEVTPAGKAFLEHAQLALTAVESAQAAAVTATGMVVGRLTLGAISTLTAVDLVREIKTYRKRFPDVDVSLVAVPSEELIARVRRAEIDIGYIGVPPGTATPGVLTRTLSRDELVLVVPAGHQIAARKRLQPKDLEGYTFVDFPSGSHARAESDIVFAQSNVRRRVQIEVDSQSVLVDCVRAGLGFALMPADVAARYRTLQSVRLAAPPTRLQQVIWNPLPSPAARAYLKLQDG